MIPVIIYVNQQFSMLVNKYFKSAQALNKFVKTNIRVLDILK